MSEDKRIARTGIEVPDGMDIVRYVSQGDLWATPDGMVKVSDMAWDHKRHAARWMERNATALILMAESAMNEDIITGLRPQGLNDVLALMNRKPGDWVARTPLYLALTAMNTRDTLL